MAKSRITLAVAALFAAVSSFSVVAHAATAHNLQTGAGTSNVYDNASDAAAKQR